MMMSSTSLLVFVINIQIMFIAILLYEKYTIYSQQSCHATKTPNDMYVRDSHEITDGFSSSVFCTGKTKDNRECHFQNLCYYPWSQKYLFFHGNTTRFFGVHYNSSKSVMLDMSSVNDHNAKYFRYTDVVSSQYAHLRYHYIKGNSILFHRFNPENIMHVFHDDLIPYFHTRRKYFPTTKNNTPVYTIFMDGRDQSPFEDLYELFIPSELTLHGLTNFTCFENVVVGLSKTTTWYQYGFQTPQGPINVDMYPKLELRYFVKEFLQLMPRDSLFNEIKMNDISDCIVFISRKTTRKIVNEAELVIKLSSYFNLPVFMFDLQFDHFSEIVTHISKARVLVSVHGAQLVTSLFLRPGSLVIEIFPFAVPSENYTPYKTLCSLMDLRYISWENRINSNSYPHPDWPAKLGGIAHLPHHLQVKIKETPSVPPHLCCTDPFWLYRIYQDTRVDLNNLINHISTTTPSSRTHKNNQNTPNKVPKQPHDNHPFFPETVHNVRCERTDTGQFYITWKRPCNIEWVHDDVMLEYEVKIVESIEEELRVVSTDHVTGKQRFLLNGDRFINSDRYFVQVRCIFNGNFGEQMDLLRIQC